MRAFGVEPVAGAARDKDSNPDAPDEAAPDPGAAVRALAKRVRPRSRDAAVGVRGAVTRLVEIDASFTDEAMASRIAVDADGYLPFPADEAAIDFEVGDLSLDDPELVEVVFAACPRQEVERLRLALARGGLRARAADVREFALGRALRRPEGEGATALIELGPEGVSMTVFGGAERLPAVVGGDPGSGAPIPGEAWSEGEIGWRVEGLLHRHAETGGGRLETAVVAGELATRPELAAAACRAAGVPARVADPFAGMALAPGIEREALARLAPALLAACGLALRVASR